MKVLICLICILAVLLVGCNNEPVFVNAPYTINNNNSYTFFITIDVCNENLTNMCVIYDNKTDRCVIKIK